MSMRELTEQELKLAPGWAYMYSITSNNNVRFHDDFMFCLCNGHVVSDVVSAEPKNFSARLINKKPFDITKHKFGDTAWSINEVNAEQGYIDFYNDETCTDDGNHESHLINEDDAIAIAKALGATAKDFS